MNSTDSKTTSNKPQASMADVPKRGGFYYWLLIVFLAIFVFFGTAIFTSLALIAFFRYAAWVGLATGTAATVFFMIKRHQKFKKMSPDTYRCYFTQTARQSVFTHEDYARLDEPSIASPRHSLYWMTGAGSPVYKKTHEWH